MVNTDEKGESTPATITPTPIPTTSTDAVKDNEGQKGETTPATPTATKVEVGKDEGNVKGDEKKEAEHAVPPVPVIEPERKMRAVVLSSYGGLKNVKNMERPVPSAPKDNEVTIQVKISGLNFQDLLLRLGFLDIIHKSSFILGTELVGLVTAVGSKVTKVIVGDLVFAIPLNGGAWAEFINLEENLVIKVSEPQLPLEMLGSTLPYLVAQLLLNRVPGLDNGANVLVQSAGGGVGLALKELASLKGINVIGVASATKHEALAPYGFKQLIKRGQQDYVTEVKRLYPGGLDAVFDSQGGEDILRGISLLAPWGTYIMYGNGNLVTGENRSFFSMTRNWLSNGEKVFPVKLYEDNKVVGGLNVRQLIRNCPSQVEKALRIVWDLMAKDQIHPVVDTTFSLDQMMPAMQRMHERKNIGKILVVPELVVEVPQAVEQATPATEQATPATEESKGDTTTANPTGDKDGETSSTESATAK